MIMCSTPVLRPLLSDQARHTHFVTSFAHPISRYKDHLRTPRSIRITAFSARSHSSSSTSSLVKLTMTLPGLPDLLDPIAQHAPTTPRSHATYTIGFPVSPTIRTTPSPNSRSHFFRFSDISTFIVDTSTVRGNLRSPARRLSQLRDGIQTASNDTPVLSGALTLEGVSLYSGRHFPTLSSMEVRA